MNPLGTKGDPKLRSVAEDRILDYLLLIGFSRDVRDGKKKQAAEAARCALARWVQIGLPQVTDAQGTNHYDPFEVVNFMKWVGRHQSDPFWTENYIETARKNAYAQDAVWAEGVLPLIAGMLPNKKFQVIYMRTFNLSSFEPGTSVRLRLPVPMEDERLSLLSFQISHNADPDIQYRKLPHSLEARLKVPVSGKLNLSYQTEFEARTYQQDGRVSLASAHRPLKNEEWLLNTEPSEGFIRVSPRVLDLAHELTATDDTPEGCVRAFWNYLMDHMMFGMIHYHEIDMAQPMDWLLDHVWSDCQLGAALFVSLCRAKKIPARIRGGVKLYPDACDPHYWPEAWLEGRGWTPFDFGAWDLSRSGQETDWRDIYFGAIDYRMTTECFPRHFVGPMSLRLPEQWNLITKLETEGTSTYFSHAITGAPIYSDHITVKQISDVTVGGLPWSH